MLEDILIPDSKKTPMIALPDRSYIIQQGNSVEVLGEAYLLKDGEIKQICENGQNLKFIEDRNLIL
jgi:hypothetical protein